MKYELFLRKKYNYIPIFTILLLILITFLIFIILYYKYDLVTNTSIQIIKKEESYFAKVYLKYNDINILKNAILVIDDKKYNYTIKEISSEYYLDDNLNKYIEIILDINLNDVDKINNNILNISFINGKTTIYEYLKKIMKGWLND